MELQIKKSQHCNSGVSNKSGVDLRRGEQISKPFHALRRHKKRISTKTTATFLSHFVLLRQIAARLLVSSDSISVIFTSAFSVHKNISLCQPSPSSLCPKDIAAAWIPFCQAKPAVAPGHESLLSLWKLLAPMEMLCFSLSVLTTVAAGEWSTFRESLILPSVGSRPKYFTCHHSTN